jgi:hypothetical protein
MRIKYTYKLFNHTHTQFKNDFGSLGANKLPGQVISYLSNWLSSTWICMHGDHSQYGALLLLKEVYTLLLSQESCCIWNVHKRKAYIPYNFCYYTYVYLSYSATNTCIRKNEMHMVFWIVTSLSLVGGYQCFGGTLVCHTRLSVLS